MKLLITGADRPLGKLAVHHFGAAHTLRLTGIAAGGDVQVADLREPEEVASLVAGMDAILHLAEYDPAPVLGPTAEQDRLEIAARGSYVLLEEARKAGVDRVVLASTLALMDAYPEEYVVDENWMPRPGPHADSLAPYMAEIVCREFAREGGIRCVCLRFGTLGDLTPEEDALQALDRALAVEFKDPGYRWFLLHVAASDRFLCGEARRVLQLDRKGGA
ncbi:MAG: NAD(P)-dependent oxidoreductase [bacterium]|nr:NAD(P)-dependent oxidoreductase [bacterium]